MHKRWDRGEQGDSRRLSAVAYHRSTLQTCLSNKHGNFFRLALKSSICSPHSHCKIAARARLRILNMLHTEQFEEQNLKTGCRHTRYLISFEPFRIQNPPSNGGMYMHLVARVNETERKSTNGYCGGYQIGEKNPKSSLKWIFTRMR